MAFEGLSAKLQNVFKNLRGKGRLSESDVKAAMKEVKMALLEADVSFKVVKSFINDVTERAVGQDVLNSLTPGQMVIKIVNEELTKPMGDETVEIGVFCPHFYHDEKKSYRISIYRLTAGWLGSAS